MQRFFLMTHPADVNPVPREQEKLLEFEFGGDKSYSGLSFWLTDVRPGVCEDPDVWQVLPETCVVAATDTSSWNQLIHIADPCWLVYTLQVYGIAPALSCTDAWPFFVLVCFAVLPVYLAVPRPVMAVLCSKTYWVVRSLECSLSSH